MKRQDWQAHWTAHGQPWRTEPEITTERQVELCRLLAIDVDEDDEPYPFNRSSLRRADIEWMVAYRAERIAQGATPRTFRLWGAAFDVEATAEEFTVDLTGLLLDDFDFAMTYYEDVTFAGSHFTHCRLSGAIILEDLNLAGAIITGDLNLTGARVEDYACIERATIFGTVWLNYMHVEKWLSLEETIVLGDLHQERIAVGTNFWTRGLHVQGRIFA